jgi:hypothetical protein
MFGIVPQLPLSAEELVVLEALPDEPGLAAEEDELEELEEHAVAAASSRAPLRPSVSRAVLCLMQNLL